MKVRKIPLLVLAAATLHAQPAAEVRGSVVDARGGEALSSVVVQLLGGAYRATTDSAGRFRITGVAAGDSLRAARRIPACLTAPQRC